MQEFKTWFEIGFDHIINYQALDHILFIVVLTVIYDIKMIKKIIILITAFTVGHTLTLILSTLNLIQYDQKIIEFAIPLTIAITAINNIRKRNQTLLGGGNLNYYLALFFGLIHGLGFSNYLKALLIGDNILLELFSFNIGVEIGQIVIVLLFLFVGFIFSKIFFSKRNEWILFVSSLILGISLLLITNAKFW
ncbi:MAG: HupE/UreJ family protein [Bacteroidota bacterium]|nr:HupE/UreJ family protein [Bacteroidota bacterium]|tara:strand:- start:7224 stop:7802 length:579 start_codon:yes stop_codon:yes gene_type:complete